MPFLVPFIRQRRLRTIGGFLITSFLLALLSVITIGLGTSLRYPRYLFNIDKLARGVNDPRDMPNLRGLVDVLLRIHVRPDIVQGGIALLSFLLLAWLARRRIFCVPSETTAFSLAFSLDAVVTIIVSYHAHVFDLAALIPALAVTLGFILRGERIRASIRKMLVAALGCILFAPLYLVLSMWTRSTILLCPLLFFLALAIYLATVDLERSGAGGTDAIRAGVVPSETGNCSGLRKISLAMTKSETGMATLPRPEGAGNSPTQSASTRRRFRTLRAIVSGAFSPVRWPWSCFTPDRER